MMGATAKRETFSGKASYQNEQAIGAKSASTRWLEESNIALAVGRVASLP